MAGWTLGEWSEPRRAAVYHSSVPPPLIYKHRIPHIFLRIHPQARQTGVAIGKMLRELEGMIEALPVLPPPEKEGVTR